MRFSDPGLLTAWTRSKGFAVGPLVDGLGVIPWQLLQGAFQLLRPTLPLSKAVMLLDRAWNDEFLDGFLAIEAWGNDNVSLPGEFYRTYVEELIRKVTRRPSPASSAASSGLSSVTQISVLCRCERGSWFIEPRP